MERRPGRPREYDPELALQDAMDAFWEGGFAGTSLDALSERTGMNRPSLYAAFGDKQALYLKTLQRYGEAFRDIVVGSFGQERPLAPALRKLFHRLIDFFLEGECGPRGCYLMGTAVTEALVNPEVLERLAASRTELDGFFRSRFAEARAHGELAGDPGPADRAALASAVVHDLANRARSGQPRAQLRRFADSAVKMLCVRQRRSRRA
jgi:AcrR family transcriptional regulator